MEIPAKVVLITGASQGLGAAMAAAFAQRGAKLSLTARSEDLLRAVSADALITPGDLTDAAVRERVVHRTVERFGAIDILIHNAGVGLYADAWRAPEAETRRMFELNLFAPLALTQLVAPLMRARRRGLIVSISSIAAGMTLPWFTLYSATKSALSSLSEGLSVELKRDGIRTMTVYPGYVRTAFQDHVLLGKPPERLRRGKKFAVSAAECAQAVVRGVERDARRVVIPTAGRLIVALWRIFPSLVEARLCRIYESREQAP